MTPDEMQQTFAIFDGQELGCHRYAGINPEEENRIRAVRHSGERDYAKCLGCVALSWKWFAK